MSDVRVERGHCIECLHHIRAVLAGLRKVGFKMKRSLQGANGLKDLLCFLGGMSADMQQRQDERSQLMTQGQSREFNALWLTIFSDREAGPTLGGRAQRTL